MNKLGFSTSIYYPEPQCVRESFSNFVEASLNFGGRSATVIDLKNKIVEMDNNSTSCLLTALKILLVPLTFFIFPAVMLLAKAYLRSSNDFYFKFGVIPPLKGSGPDIQVVVDSAPKFNRYVIGLGTPYEGASLTSTTRRPSNLFFDALLGEGKTTQPGSGELFEIKGDHTEIHKMIFSKDPNEVLSFTAKNEAGAIHSGDIGYHEIKDLSALYGDATYRISYGELQETLDSQKIYCADLLPVQFYRALKAAMIADEITVLPGNDRGGVGPLPVKDLASKHCQNLIVEARSHPDAFGFKSEEQFNELIDLSIYQLGSLVVKSEDYRIFMDSDGKIIERNPGENDAIRLINACGIRGVNFREGKEGNLSNHNIMLSGFKAAITASEKGLLVFPAVGMGVWGGDPELYWGAFLDAVIATAGDIEQIYINPGHRETPPGRFEARRFEGKRGGEFQIMLDEFKTKFAADPVALERLNKIINVTDRGTDVVHLSHQLKKAYPDRIVSLFNASDPDVTLGNHVGEYVNNIDHADTTEENYTAMGTNGLCFESITQVHTKPSRIISVFAL